MEIIPALYDETLLVSEVPEKRLMLVRPGARLKSLTADALLWGVLGLLLITGIINANSLRRPSISLRYETPVSGQAAYQARRFAVRQNSEYTFWPTFWHEEKVEFASELGSAGAICIVFSGDASLVWPSEYLNGAAPGLTDPDGCAVSTALAWQLWGGYDVVGKALEIDGDICLVKGVFKGDESLALRSVGDEETGWSFTAVELTGGPSGSNRSDAQSFAVSAGLGVPDSVLLGIPAFLASLFASLPLLILFGYWLSVCLSRFGKHRAAMKWITFTFIIIIAVLLPGILNMLPDRVIPTRWSDFSFWGALIRDLSGDLHEYLTLTPKQSDVAYKISFFKQIGIAFLSLTISLCVCFRNSSRYAKQKDKKAP